MEHIVTKMDTVYNRLTLNISKPTTTSVWIWKRKITKTQRKQTQQETMCTQYTHKNEVAIEFSKKNVR